MSRSLYYFAIFISVLFVIISLFQSMLYFDLSGQLYTLETMPDWYLFGSIIALLSAVLLLKYYHFKQYKVAYVTAFIATIAGICHFIIVYARLMAWKLGDWYLIAGFAALTTAMIYSISLIFSKARERFWLKTGGIFSFIVQFAIVSSSIWGLNSHEAMVSGTIEQIHKWAALGGSFLQLFFLINFVGELMAMKDGQHVASHKAWDVCMIVTGTMAVFGILFFAPKLSAEANSMSSWINRGPERAEALAEPFEARTYVNDEGRSMPYRLLRPLHYDSSKKYPIVVCLHGGGGWGTDNIKQIEGSWMAQLLTRDDNREKYEAFLLVPQCPPGFSWGGVPMHPSVDSLVFGIMAELEQEFSIDITRRYVAGESLGGYGAWHFICARPKIFAAAVPVCGVGNPDLAAIIKDVPVWAFHGAKDRNVPVRGSRDMVEAMRNAGGNPKYNEYPDAGHIISEELFNTPALLEWLFVQRRVTSPAQTVSH